MPQFKKSPGTQAPQLLLESRSRIPLLLWRTDSRAQFVSICHVIDPSLISQLPEAPLGVNPFDNALNILPLSSRLGPPKYWSVLILNLCLIETPSHPLAIIAFDPDPGDVL